MLGSHGLNLIDDLQEYRVSILNHWNKIEILYNGKLQEMWRIELNFVYSLGNSALSSTFPKVFRCTKFQFCSSESV